MHKTSRPFERPWRRIILKCISDSVRKYWYRQDTGGLFFVNTIMIRVHRRENFLTTSVGTTFEGSSCTKHSLHLNSLLMTMPVLMALRAPTRNTFFFNSFNDAFRITYVDCMGGFLWRTGKGMEGSSIDKVTAPAFVWRYWRKSRRIKITPCIKTLFYYSKLVHTIIKS